MTGRANYRVLYVGNFLKTRAMAWQYCNDLSAHLEDWGVNVLRASRFKNRALRLLDMATLPLRSRTLYDLVLIDVFSGPSFVWAETAARAAMMAGKPFVLILHGGGLPEFALRWPDRIRWLFLSANTLTSPSRYLAERFRDTRADVEVIPNAIDVGQYPYRLRCDVQPRIIWLRAFHEIYGPGSAVKALARLRRVYPSAGLTMIGPDKRDGTLNRVRRMIHELNLADNVEIIPGIHKREVVTFLQGADIFLNTPSVDNTPVSVIEAMACGLCIVSSNVGGIPYLLNDGRDALLIPVNQPEQIASAICHLIEDPGLAERLSRSGRAKVETFDWEEVIPRWLEVFEKVLSNSRGIG